MAHIPNKFEQLDFFRWEVLGELGWCDEIEETGVDQLAYARDEIKSLQRHVRRVNRPLVSQDALYLASVWDTLVESGYLTEEFINNHVGVVSAATLASKTLQNLAAAEQSFAADGARRCPACKALLEDRSVYCDNCGTDTPRS